MQGSKTIAIDFELLKRMRALQWDQETHNRYLDVDGHRILVKFDRRSNEALDAHWFAFSTLHFGISLQTLAKLCQSLPTNSLLPIPCS